MAMWTLADIQEEISDVGALIRSKKLSPDKTGAFQDFLKVGIVSKITQLASMRPKDCLLLLLTSTLVTPHWLLTSSSTLSKR